MGLLVFLPALAVFGMAFTHANPLQPITWAGLDNFRTLWQSTYVRTGLYNSLIFVGTAVPLRLAVALFFAVLFEPNGRSQRFFRTAVYLPTIIPEPAYALIWLWLLNPVYGPLNILLHGLGLPAPAWLVNPNSARAAIILLSIFQIGEGFVVLLAGLQSIPTAVYDAARVDGANTWDTFWQITFPLLLPWLLLLGFRDVLMALQNTFTPAYILTYGGPYYATTFLPLLIYEVAFDIFDFGLAAAILILVYLASLALLIGIWQMVDLQEEVDEI